MSRKLNIATSQFAVDGDVGKNLSMMRKQIRLAAENKADVIHFSECCLSSYAGIDFEAFTSEANTKIQNGINTIRELAQRYNIWVIFGTHLFEGNVDKPFNSLFVINSKGAIDTRYDKRLLSEFDMDWYTAGTEPGLFSIKGIECGLLICHEWRYPELYRQYYKLGVEILFQSWYDGNYSEEEYESEGKNLGEIIPGFVRGNAANNKLWISASNTCKRQQSFPAFVTRPDGVVHGKLNRNRSGVLISEIDPDEKYSDLSGHLRDKVSRMKY